MKKFFGFGSSTPPPPPAPPVRPPAAPPPSGTKATGSASLLIGQWREPKGSDTTEFHSDGTVTEKPISGGQIRGRYTLEGTKLKIRLEGVPEELSFSAVIKTDTLEMTGPDGQMTSYVRAQG